MNLHTSLNLDISNKDIKEGVSLTLSFEEARSLEHKLREYLTNARDARDDGDPSYHASVKLDLRRPWALYHG